MRKIFTIILLLQFSTQVIAQNVTVSIGGGAAIQTSFTASSHKVPNGLCAMFKAGYSVKSFYFGARLDAYRINGRTRNLALLPSVFISHQFSGFEFGVIGGLVLDNPSNQSPSYTVPEYTSKTNGFFGGIQISYTHFFAKHFGAFANASPRILALKEKNLYNASITQFSFPINIGVAVRF